MISKYVDHLPLYRQEQMSPRWGASIHRRTMCDWIEVAALWLDPIYRHMHRTLLAGNYLQDDETPIQIMIVGRPCSVILGDQPPGVRCRLRVPRIALF